MGEPKGRIKATLPNYIIFLYVVAKRGRRWGIGRAVRAKENGG